MGTPATVQPQSVPKLPKMSMQRRFLAAGVANGESIAEAGRKAGYANRFSAHEAYTDMRSRLCGIMDDIGLDERSILLKLRDLTDANKTTPVVLNGELIRFDAPDNQARNKAIETVAKIRGISGDDSAHASIGSINIVWGGAAPAWAMSRLSQPTPERLPKGNSNASPTHSLSHRISNSTIDMAPPRSAIEGTGSDEGGCGHTHPAKKPRRKSGPRLPVYKGRARRD